MDGRFTKCKIPLVGFVNLFGYVMTFGERLKAIRGDLNQESFAIKCGFHKNTIGRWERNEQCPNVDDLNRILATFPDINPTWLLTGGGRMKIEATSEWWSEKIKEMRGNLTISEFVRKARFADHERGVATIQAIEDGKMDADFMTMLVFAEELGINPNWMFGYDASMKREISERIAQVSADQPKPSANYIDVEEGTAELIDRLLNEKSAEYGELTGGKAIILMTTLYRIYSRNFYKNADFRRETLERTVDALFRLAVPSNAITDK